MTQIADSPRAHKLKASGRGIPVMLQPHDVLAPGLASYQGAPPLLPVPAWEQGSLEQRAVELDAGELDAQLQGPAAAAGSEDLLAAVWRTSSYLEGVQWELDAAQGSLLEAVQQAALSGVDHGELCKAANMTAGELAEALRELPQPPQL